MCDNNPQHSLYLGSRYYNDRIVALQFAEKKVLYLLD